MLFQIYFVLLSRKHINNTISMKLYLIKKVKPLFILCLLSAAVVSKAAAKQGDGLRAIGFYNVENLFDTTHDEGKLDQDFTPDGSYEWTEAKYRHKLGNMAKVLAEMATDKVGAGGCDIIGLAEVENDHVLSDLVAQEPLKSRGYKFCHIEGPDMRGIDCALLYNPKKFKVRDVKLVPYVQILKKDSAFFTRGFLTVNGTYAGEHIAIVVCHLPSRASSSFYRCLGAKQVKALCDSIVADAPKTKVIVMGDMNDDPMDKSMAEELRGRRNLQEVGDDDMYNPWWNDLAEGRGTMTYNGLPNLFDQILLSRSFVSDGDTTLKFADHEIFRRDYLINATGKFKGYTKRTHSGKTWLDGYSDHLPTIIYLR